MTDVVALRVAVAGVSTAATVLGVAALAAQSHPEAAAVPPAPAPVTVPSASAVTPAARTVVVKRYHYRTRAGSPSRPSSGHARSAPVSAPAIAARPAAPTAAAPGAAAAAAPAPAPDTATRAS